MFARPKFNVTISPGSIAPFTQVSAAKAKLFETINGNVFVTTIKPACVTVLLPVGPRTVRLTLSVPGLPYTKEKLVAVVFVVTPLPKFQNRFVIVPLEVSVKSTESGALPEVGVALKEAVGAETWPQHARTWMLTVSTNQPALLTLLSVPQRHRN